MSILVRRFEESDIPFKVKWVNDDENNKYLHYDLPLEIKKTEKWYASVKGRNDRYDATVTYNGAPVGIIGLLKIDQKNKKAEFYILVGEKNFKGKGIATKASELILEYAFEHLKLNKIYLYTEIDNIPARGLFEKIGFVCEGILKNDLIYKGRTVTRILYAISKEQYFEKYHSLLKYTPIVKVGEYGKNEIYIKHEETLPYSFGGNKVRKAIKFFKEIDAGKYNYVVTYGSSSSNHCRIVANMAAERGIKCSIICPESELKTTFNSMMMKLFGAEIIVAPVEQIHETINNILTELTKLGYKPYFIPGGGHGNLGTRAYVDCFNEILQYEKREKVKFDYVFHASGTGTTQAGLICGKLMEKDSTNIIGISIARKNPYGRNVVIDSIKEYLFGIGLNYTDEEIDKATIFEDSYIGEGYGRCSENVRDVVKEIMIKHGIPMDMTYVGKAYAGMKDYINRNAIKNKKILFIHTGGTPLFFNDLENTQG